MMNGRDIERYTKASFLDAAWRSGDGSEISWFEN